MVATVSYLDPLTKVWQKAGFFYLLVATQLGWYVRTCIFIII